VIQSPASAPVPLALAEKAGESSAMVKMLSMEVERMKQENERMRMELDSAEEDADEAERTLNSVAVRPVSFWESPAGVKLLESLTDTLRPLSHAAGVWAASKVLPGAKVPLASAAPTIAGADLLPPDDARRLVALKNFEAANKDDPGMMQFFNELLAQYAPDSHGKA
jgi:FtsZ-binding cell division protein ZapB